MPATVRQHAFSPKIADGFREPSASTLWYSFGSDDEAEVLLAAQAEIPATYYNLVIKNIAYENRGGGFWDIEAKYEVPDYIESDGLGDPAEPHTPPTDLQAPIAADQHVGPEFSADTSGGTVHITQSRVTQLAKKAGGGVARDFKGAIGVTKDGVEGCDIFAAKLDFSITLKAPWITWGYIHTAYDLTGTVNDDQFLIFGERSILYLGLVPSYQSGEGWTLTHKFSYSPNETTIVISDTLTLEAADRNDGALVAKFGHEYLWVYYVESEDSGELVTRPHAAYIEEVYLSADLSALGFGGPP